MSGIAFHLAGLIEPWLLSYLVNSLWQIPLLWAAGWLAARALRRVGSSAEHRVWVSVLLAQALLPAWSAVPRQWTQTLATWLLALLPGASRGDGESGVRAVMAAGTAAGSFHIPSAWLAAVAIVYALATAFFAMRFLARCLRLSTLRRDAAEMALEGVAARDWAQCAARAGYGSVTLGVSSRIFAPVAMGVFRRLILLPAHMHGAPPDATTSAGPGNPGLAAPDLRAVFAHEFAHIERHDFLKNLLYELLSLPLHYHPLFRLTRERILETREMICDQMASQVAGRKEYARSLLRLASLLVAGAPVRTHHAIGIFDARAFERRFMRLTAKQNSLEGLRRVLLAAACCLFGLTVCGSALALGLRIDTARDTGDSKTTGHEVVSPAEAAGHIVHKVPPVYPVEAKQQRIQGTVVLDAIIGKDGSIQNLEAVSGPKELQKSAMDAVKQWLYSPFQVDGQPVEVRTKINVIYTLAK